MVSTRKVIEAILGGLLFGSVYSLCKFQLDLEVDGVQVEPGSVLGQVFWFIKIALGLIASKYASSELLGLMDTVEPMVESAVDGEGSRRRSRSSSVSRSGFIRKSPIITRGASGSTPAQKPVGHKFNCPCC